MNKGTARHKTNKSQILSLNKEYNILYDTDNDKSRNSFAILVEEYNQCILNLHQKFKISRDGRKKSEIDLHRLQNRILLLQHEDAMTKNSLEVTMNKIEAMIQKRQLKTYEKILSSHIKKQKEREMEFRREIVQMRKEGKNERIPSKSLKQSSRHIRCNSMKNKQQQVLQMINSHVKSRNLILEQFNDNDNQRRMELEKKKAKLKEELLKKIQSEEKGRSQLSVMLNKKNLFLNAAMSIDQSMNNLQSEAEDEFYYFKTYDTRSNSMRMNTNELRSLYGSDIE